MKDLKYLKQVKKKKKRVNQAEKQKSEIIAQFGLIKAQTCQGVGDIFTVIQKLKAAILYILYIIYIIQQD